MTAAAFTKTTMLNVKRALRRSFPEEKSAHLTEALAAACGYKSHAALLAALPEQEADPDYVVLDDQAFVTRLNQLTASPFAPDEDPYWFEYLTYPSKEGIVNTQSDRLFDADYKSQRSRAWRNLLVAAINAGISQRHFTVKAGDNRWPGAGGEQRQYHSYSFEIDGIPGFAKIYDAGWDEIAVSAALWPTPDGDRWLNVINAGWRAGDVIASGWFERRDGAWLQYVEKPTFRCRRSRLKEVVAISVMPTGYADRGNFKL